jgi:hypothetical protein
VITPLTCWLHKRKFLSSNLIVSECVKPDLVDSLAVDGRFRSIRFSDSEFFSDSAIDEDVEALRKRKIEPKGSSIPC